MHTFLGTAGNRRETRIKIIPFYSRHTSQLTPAPPEEKPGRKIPIQLIIPELRLSSTANIQKPIKFSCQLPAPGMLVPIRAVVIAESKAQHSQPLPCSIPDKNPATHIHPHPATSSHNHPGVNDLPFASLRTCCAQCAEKCRNLKQLPAQSNSLIKEPLLPAEHFL